MKFYIITEADVLAAGASIPLRESPCKWHKVPFDGAYYIILPASWSDIQPGEVVKLLRHLRRTPGQLIVLDAWGDAEVDVPPELRGVKVARSHYRKHDIKAKDLQLIALAPAVPDPGLQTFGVYDFDVSFIASLESGADFAAMNSLERYTYGPLRGPMMAPQIAQTWQEQLVLGLQSRGVERLADGRLRVNLSDVPDPRALLAGVAGPAANFAGAGPLRVLCKAVNDHAPRVRNALGGGGIGLSVPVPEQYQLDRDDRQLLHAVEGGGLIPSTGRIDPEEARSIYRQSRVVIAVQRFQGGSLPIECVRAAACGRPVLLVGDPPKVPGNFRDWLFEVPHDVAAEIGEVANAFVRRIDVQECGRAARAWYEANRPEAWPSLIEKALQNE